MRGEDKGEKLKKIYIVCITVILVYIFINIILERNNDDMNFYYKGIDYNSTISGYIVQVKGMEDKELQRKINQTIIEASFGWIDVAVQSTTSHFALLDQSVKGVYDKYVSIEGEYLYLSEHDNYEKSVYYYITINKETGEQVYLNDIVEINEGFGQYIRENNPDYSYFGEGDFVESFVYYSMPLKTYYKNEHYIIKCGFWFDEENLNLYTEGHSPANVNGNAVIAKVDLEQFLINNDNNTHVSKNVKMSAEEISFKIHEYSSKDEWYSYVYPELYGLKDKKMQCTLNKQLKYYLTGNAISKLDSKYKCIAKLVRVELINSQYICLSHYMYTEDYNRIYYTFSMDNGELLKLNDLVNLNILVKMFRNGDYSLLINSIPVFEKEIAEIKDYVASLTDEDIHKILKELNMTFDDYYIKFGKIKTKPEWYIREDKLHVIIKFHKNIVEPDVEFIFERNKLGF